METSWQPVAPVSEKLKSQGPLAHVVEIMKRVARPLELALPVELLHSETLPLPSGNYLTGSSPHPTPRAQQATAKGYSLTIEVNLNGTMAKVSGEREGTGYIAYPI